MQERQNSEYYLVGIDVGSTTTKVTAADPDTGEIIYADYRRHHAEQLKSVQEGVKRLADSVLGRSFRAVMTGSGAKVIADAAHAARSRNLMVNVLSCWHLVNSGDTRFAHRGILYHIFCGSMRCN